MDSMSFLEQGVAKLVLTPNMIKYVEMSISEKSKEEHMEQISNYYTSILKDFFKLHCGNNDKFDRKTESKSDKQDFNIKDMM